MTVAAAINDDAVAVNFFAFFGKKVDGEFGPLADGLISAEFNAVLPDANSRWGKGQASLGAMNMEALKDARCIEFASAHIG